MKKQITLKKLFKHCNRFEIKVITENGDKIYLMPELIQRTIDNLKSNPEIKQIQYFKNEINE